MQQTDWGRSLLQRLPFGLGTDGGGSGGGGGSVLPRLAGIVAGALWSVLGLLGTVLGFIKVFTNLQAAGVYAHGGMMAEGIGQALICCAAGLAVAIPLHAGYNYLVSRVNNIVADMGRAANEIVGIVTENGRAKPA